MGVSEEDQLDPGEFARVKNPPLGPNASDAGGKGPIGVEFALHELAGVGNPLAFRTAARFGNAATQRIGEDRASAGPGQIPPGYQNMHAG